jgi:hypothetical protein
MVSGKPKPTLMDTAFSVVFGPYGPLTRHVFHSTATFLFILFCFFLVKTATENMFPPNEYVTIVLHLVDNYAGSLGLIGYIVWTSMDIAFLLRERFGPRGKKG